MSGPVDMPEGSRSIDDLSTVMNEASIVNRENSL